MSRNEHGQTMVEGKQPTAESAAFSCSPFFGLLALLGLLALGNGCAAASALPIGSIVGSPNASSLQINNNTYVRLQEKNFVMVKTNLAGHSSGFSLLGILTIVPARFEKAMNRLYAQAEIQQGRPQTLVNLIMEQDSVYLILFSIPKTSVRADLVEFVPANDTGSQARPPPKENDKE
jgi:hypothetical protein